MTVAQLYKRSKKQREVEEVARKAKNRQAGGGGRKAGMGEQNTRGVMNGRIAKKKGFKAKESGGARTKAKQVFVVEIVKAEGEEGKENISAVVFAAKSDEEKPSAPAEVPVIN